MILKVLLVWCVALPASLLALAMLIISRLFEAMAEAFGALATSISEACE